MTDRDYYAIDGAITATAIKAGRRSMRSMRRRMTERDTSDTPSMRWGRLVHLAVLEPERVGDLPVWPAGERKAGQEWAAFKASAGDGDYITDAELADLLPISAAVRQCEIAHLLCGGSAERVLRWTDPTLGACKCKVDYLTGRGTIIDLKTARDVSARRFMRQADDLGYHLQLGWYALGVDRLLHQTSEQHYVVAVQTGDELDVVVYEARAPVVMAGQQEAIEIARRYRATELMGGPWHGVSGGVILPYEVPSAKWKDEGEVDLSDGEMEASAL